MMPIFLLDSSFGEVQDRSKDHLDKMSRTRILNLFHMCKVGLIYPTCIRDVSHTPTNDYILERLGVHLINTFCGGTLFFLGWCWSSVLDSAFRASWCSVLVERSWWDVLGLGDTCGRLTLWRLCWLKHPTDRCNAPILYLCFGLSSIDLYWYVLSTSYFHCALEGQSTFASKHRISSEFNNL